MEKNCEERTVKVIRDNELDINLKEYIISSNLYILFYSILLKTRRWYKTSPFIIRPLFDYVPCDKIVEDFRITKDLEKKIIEYCY